MGGINGKRVLIGGVVAGLVLFVLEGLGSMLYHEDLAAAMEAHNLSMEMTPAGFVLPLLVSLILGIMLVWFYAAVRPRLGPGPKTALVVAVALYLGGYFLSLLGYQMIGLFPVSLIVLWAIVGLIEMILASITGAWLYREP